MSDDSPVPAAAEPAVPSSTSLPTSNPDPSPFQMDEDEDEPQQSTTTTAAPASSNSLADFMNDGDDETLQEQVADDARATAAAAAISESTDAEMTEEGAAAGEEAAEGETPAADEEGAAAGEGEGEGGEEATAEGGDEDAELVASFRTHLKEILANLDSTRLSNMHVKDIMNELKEKVGKKTLKRHKDLAKRLAKEAAQTRLEEVQASVPDEQPAEEQEEEEPVGDEEDYDDDEQPKHKHKRRKAGSDDDGDYDERPSSKKKVHKKKSSSSTTAAASSSSTSALRKIPLPKSAYQIFSQAERGKIREESPDLSQPEVMKLIGERWTALDQEFKAEYETMATKGKEVYQAALEKLREEDPEAYEAHVKQTKQSGKKRKKEQEGGSGEYDDDPEDGRDPDEMKELTYFDSIVQDLKAKRQTKSELSEEDQKIVAELFVQRMAKAAEKDVELAKLADPLKPAVARLQMLPEVQLQVSKSNVSTLLMDAGLLKVFNKWLTPEADGTLPNIRIRTAFYQLLTMLPINESDLANSQGLGKTIMRLWRDPDETLGNKKVLESLLQKWMRPLLGLETSFRRLSDVDEERANEIVNRKSLLDTQKPQANYNPKRAFLPQPARFDYAIRPQASRDHDDEAEEAKEVAAKKRQEIQSKKTEMSKKMEKMKRSSNMAKPKFKVDITGRTSNL